MFATADFGPRPRYINDFRLAPLITDIGRAEAAGTSVLWKGCSKAAEGNESCGDSLAEVHLWRGRLDGSRTSKVASRSRAGFEWEKLPGTSSLWSRLEAAVSC